MATVKGTTPPAFGIQADAESLLTQRISVTEKVDKKEARDKQGDVKAVAYYNDNVEVNIEGIGDVSTALIATVTIPAGVTKATAGILIAEEVSREYANEEFVKSTVKGTCYKLITS